MKAWKLAIAAGTVAASLVGCQQRSSSEDDQAAFPVGETKNMQYGESQPHQGGTGAQNVNTAGPEQGPQPQAQQPTQQGEQADQATGGSGR